MNRAILIACGLLLPLLAGAQGYSSPKKIVKLMGSRFEFTAVAENEATAWEAIRAGIAEVERIERLISSWDSQSQTSAINRQAGIAPVEVDRELFDLIYRAKKVSKLTQGAFDISFASMERIWTFDGGEHAMPPAGRVAEAAALINWQDIELDADKNTVFLRNPGMRIGFGAIGKGYAANRAKAVMSKVTGLKGGVVNAGGDLIAWGDSAQPGGWTIQIADPNDRDRALAWLQVNDLAVVTSGDYEKFAFIDGQRYAHIVDPRTGYPTTGTKSVTIVCPDAELSDALATSVFVLGPENGMNLINQLQGVECLIVDDHNEVLTSDHLQLNYYK